MTREALLEQLDELLDRAMIIMEESEATPDDGDEIYHAISTARDLVTNAMIMENG